MYKCLDCGHIFGEGEQVALTAWDGATITGCPICGGGFAETEYCEACCRECLEDELYGGLCLDCLRKDINYDSALDYMVERDVLVDFMVVAYYGCEYGMPHISDKFRNVMRECFLREKADDMILGKNTFLEAIRKYLVDDSSECDIHDFAEWLKENG